MEVTGFWVSATAVDFDNLNRTFIRLKCHIHQAVDFDNLNLIFIRLKCHTSISRF